MKMTQGASNDDKAGTIITFGFQGALVLPSFAHRYETPLLNLLELYLFMSYILAFWLTLLVSKWINKDYQYIVALNQDYLIMGLHHWYINPVLRDI